MSGRGTLVLNPLCYSSQFFRRCVSRYAMFEVAVSKLANGTPRAYACLVTSGMSVMSPSVDLGPEHVNAGQNPCHPGVAVLVAFSGQPF
eukprot:366490-Chlamydomonas_euryale.AAC.20